MKPFQIRHVKFMGIFFILLIAFQNCSFHGVGFDSQTQESQLSLSNSRNPGEPNPISENDPDSAGPVFSEIGPFDIDVLNDISIAEVPVLDSSIQIKNLKMNLWYPLGVSAALPLVVHIHGGGWKSGDYNQCFNYSRNGQSSNLCKDLARRGYAVASITYRLSSEAKFPAQIQDVKTALRFIRKNAETIGLGKFKIHKEKISVFGSSAGAHLAMLVGTSKGSPELSGVLFSDESDQVNSVVSMYGPTDFSQMDSQLAQTFTSFQSHNGSNSGESLLLGCLTTLQDCASLANAANPITYVSGDEPPFFLRHGRADTVVPYQQSEIIHSALISKAISSDLKILDNIGHSFNADIASEPLAAEAYDDSIAFLDKTLKGIEPMISSGISQPIQDQACGKPGSRTQFTSGQYSKTLSFQNRTRNYRVDIPSNYNPEVNSYPVIFLIHGRGGTIDSFQNQTKMSEKANAKGFIVVTPEGTTSTLLPGQTTAGLVFNAGFNKAAVADPSVDDVGFITSLLDLIVDDYKIDCHRIYMAGFSMGAMMTYKMASQIPQRLAGIGIVAGTIGSFSSQVPSNLNALQNFAEEVPIPLIAFHSTDDNAVAFRGCEASGSYYYPVIDELPCASNVSSIGYFKSSVNKCAQVNVSSIGTDIVKKQFTQCARLSSTSNDQAEIEFYQLSTGSHRWPGGTDPNANQEINATDLILEFFTRSR